MPEPSISDQPVFLQAAQPEPLHSVHSTSISADGSVNGKKLGRKRVRVDPKNLLAKWVSVAFRSTKLIPSSTDRPSICANTGACDASKKSRRYTLPGARMRIGGLNDWSVLICTGDVCVRRRTLSSR